MPRLEFQAPPDVFYNESEVPKYTTSSRIIEIQSRISERALELLALPNDGVPKLLLDIGCGSGLSGETLMEHGHHWIGYDISKCCLAHVRVRVTACNDSYTSQISSATFVLPMCEDLQVATPDTSIRRCLLRAKWETTSCKNRVNELAKCTLFKINCTKAQLFGVQVLIVSILKLARCKRKLAPRPQPIDQGLARQSRAILSSELMILITEWLAG
ncbi:unnamed protein product [Miscanthus lutarioriparius]|uniref:Uncharacterized protein n=1 Tax=Miscanthus lutarioriparius TaxID=422564 RepID=A0A811MAQ5_9POAL|nr:unnamed protein product [Miscanthus lutarioriparius]